jgi:hypothetical protein
MNKLRDEDIRKLLIRELVKKNEFIYDQSTFVVSELDIGNARIDLAVINGQLHGFEIKSERDKLDRLPSQIEYYSKVFDTVTLVVSENHLDKAKAMVPSWWGIDCVVKKKLSYSLKTIRKSKFNNGVQPLELSLLLWKDELIELLELNSITKGIKSKSRYDLGRIASEKIDLKQLSLFVKSKLKRREDWRALPLQQLYDDLQQLSPS